MGTELANSVSTFMDFPWVCYFCLKALDRYTKKCSNPNCDLYGKDQE